MAQPSYFLSLRLKRSTTTSSSGDSVASDSLHTRPSSSPRPFTSTFKLKSLNTGEEIDLRYENSTSFFPKFSHMLTLKGDFCSRFQSYLYVLRSEQRRQANHRLWESAETGDLACCLDALNQAEPNSKGLNEWTALHLAAHNGHISVCLMLLQPRYCMDVNAVTELNRTALHLAAIKGHAEIVESLLAHGADGDIVDKGGWTALHHAANMSHTAVIQLLINAGVSQTLTDHQGKTAFEIASTAEAANLLDATGGNQYSRTMFNGVLIRNSREDRVTGLLRQYSEKKLPVKDGEVDTSPSTQDDRMHVIGPADFQPICLLGKGSFGEVFYCKKGEEEFALKVLNKSQVLTKNVLRYTQTEREVLSLIHHPFIVELKYAFQTTEKLILALEYCPGGDLGYHLSREKRFSEDRARIYLSEILLALEELHSHHIIYRDLKPDNVVLDSDGHAKLTDFGLAKIAKDNQAKSFCGSVAYLAPELIQRQVYGPEVDWYLMGVLLYEMLVGIPPFFSCNKDLLFSNIQKARIKFPKFISSTAQHLITLLMDRDPRSRLGINGSDEIKQHPFFSSIDWRAALNKRLKPMPVQRINRKQEVLRLEEVFGDGSKKEMGVVEDWKYPTSEKQYP